MTSSPDPDAVLAMAAKCGPVGDASAETSSFVNRDLVVALLADITGVPRGRGGMAREVGVHSPGRGRWVFRVR